MNCLPSELPTNVIEKNRMRLILIRAMFDFRKLMIPFGSIGIRY